MENEIDQAIVDLGNKAKRIRESLDFMDVVEHIKGDLFKQFTKTNVGDVQSREDLHKLAYAVEYFEHKLAKYVDAAEHEIKTKTDEDEDA